ncbi:hypothetical protein GYMLUDRAFT_35764 [Collybiopsis luxurians FD-317 M1]|nr:hypothetical protein GYMLUDRAFT_35764 [Collybiopsis luxurians FD-317 M1]
MPAFLSEMWKLVRHGQYLCIYPAAFESDDERKQNFSFPKNIQSEEVTITTSDKVTLKCYILRASQRRTRSDPPSTPHSRNVEMTSRSKSPSRTPPRAVVLLFHGNAYHAWNHAYSGQQFARLGCDALMVSYRGYGHSTGRPSEKGLRRDAQAALDYVLADPVLSKCAVILHGHSLGGAVALSLASRNPDKISGLIVENTFLSIPLVAKEIPVIRHLTCFIHQKWESNKRIKKIPKTVPILMLSGKSDEVVPESHMLKLWDIAATRGEAKSPKDKMTSKSKSEEKESGAQIDHSNDIFKSIPGGTHADTWTRSGYWSTISKFLEKLNL